MQTQIRLGIYGILWILLSVSASAQTHSLAFAREQSTDVDKKPEQEMLLADLLEQIEKNHAVRFNYESDAISNKVIKVDNAAGSLQEIISYLNETLEELGLTLKEIKNDYFLIVDQKTLPQKLEPGQPHSIKDWQIVRKKNLQENLARLTNKGMAGYEKDIRISGKVTDLESNEPLPGVNVVAKNTTIGTVTDIEGNYQISVPDNTTTLVFSSVGYTSEEVTINRRSSIDVTLTPDLQSLSEVVVVGYGAVEKRDLTGAVSSVKSEEISRVPVTTIDQSLQGQMAGVQVTQADATPGGAVTIRVRGGSSLSAGNEPLYVVDGFPLLSNNVDFLNPNDIESIEVLKDASATAIYGARGSNGVVLITTKRGNTGTPSVEFSGYFGLQQVRKKIDMLDARSFAQITRLAEQNANFTPSFSEQEIQNLGKGTDWQDEIFQSAPIQDYLLNVSGGTDQARYMVSGGWFGQDGVVTGSKFERGTFRANTDFKLNKLNLGSTITYRRSTSEGFGAAAALGGDFNRDIITSTLFLSPTFSVYDANGNLTFEDPVGTPSANPFQFINRSSSESVLNQFLGNIYFEYVPKNWISLKSTLGLENTDNKNYLFLPADTPSGVQTNGYGEVGTGLNFNWINENFITFSPDISLKHDLSFLVGFSIQENKFEEAIASAQGFANGITGFNNLSAGETPLPAITNAAEWSFLSYYTRVNYKLLDRYLVTATLRRDGSSRFGQGNKWGTFPSVALGWRISDEPFLVDLNAVDDLKLRVSYGLTGNSDIGNYQSLAQIALGGGSRNYIIGNRELIGAANVRLANNALRWETTRQFNAGLDMAFFDSRVSATFEYYIKNTQDLLANLPLPAFTGFGTILANSGEYRIQGVELVLGGDVIRNNNLRWSSNVNVSYTDNQIVDLPANRNPSFVGGSFFADAGNRTAGGISKWEEGGRFGDFYGFVFDGLFQSQDEVDAQDQSAVGGSRLGGLKYKDLNGDGVITNEDDRQYIGSGIPDYIFGWNNTLTYKNLELSFLINGVLGNKVVNGINSLLLFPSGQTNLRAEALQYWDGPGSSNFIPRPDAAAPYPVFSTFFVEDGSYMRLRNISLSYMLPSKKMGGILAGARLFVSATNLLTLTKYSGFDPEVDSNNGGVAPGVDSDAYPMNKMYRMGLNLKF